MKSPEKFRDRYRKVTFYLDSQESQQLSAVAQLFGDSSNKTIRKLVLSMCDSILKQVSD